MVEQYYFGYQIKTNLAMQFYSKGSLEQKYFFMDKVTELIILTVRILDDGIKSNLLLIPN